MNQLDDQWQAMIQAAKQASTHAYCRYSNFRVGAAVRTASGEVFAGCNVENPSFGLSICGERNALFQAVAAGQRAIDRVVVYTPTATPTPPCGACRQVIREFGPLADVLCVCDGKTVLHKSLPQLLPDAFGPDSVANPCPPEP